DAGGDDLERTMSEPANEIDLELGGQGRDGFEDTKCFDDSTCPICLAVYNPTDMVCELKCGHLFHEKCLVSWFLSSSASNCPICRTNAVVRMPAPVVTHHTEWKYPDWSIPGLAV
ncbi:hypothetical protein FOL47_000186, partial [Perkinsus chesapeaki]